MPPRYAYWTIIVDDQPTAFRAGALDDIMPTFNRLKERQPTAKLMWFQSGKLWPSRIDAREAMQVRGARGRYSDPRQDGGDKAPSRERPKWKSKDFSNPKPPAARAEPTGRPEWKPRGSSSPPFFAKPSTSAKVSTSAKATADKTADKSEGKQARGPSSPERHTKPEWKPRGASTDRPAWKPKGAGDRPAWQSKSAPGGRPFMGRQRTDQDRPEWKPKGAAADAGAEKRQWIPKAEYKKLTGTEARRDDKWRPGGEHKDPRQKYKDAKKAKWGRFKQAIRSRAKKKS